jgi:SAM-dependent methyltransferase
VKFSESGKNLKELVNQEKLLISGVVANNRMNRERRCLGKNSYQKDLSFNPIDFLDARFGNNKVVSWLDICCGEGRALIEAAALFAGKNTGENLSDNLRIIGIDLAGAFLEYSSELKSLTLLETPIEVFEPTQEFDLITCVHGLHYIGDKLSVIQKAVSRLKKDGVFLANLELKNLKFVENQNSNKAFSEFLKKLGFIIDNRKHLLRLNGKRNFDIPFEYLGADVQAGPNYTGQSAIDSYYKL